MNGSGAPHAIEAVFREHRGRVLATLIGLLGDFDLAEEVLQEAVVAALERWPREGEPANPRAWLITVGRRRAIDRLRRRELERRKLSELETTRPAGVAEELVSEAVPDERLRLLFTCCHPALAPEAQIALTLRTLCGLTSEEIARAFLVPVATLQQRLVRAKAKIRQARIPYRIPEELALPERLAAVLRTIYLIFNEGYAPTTGEGGVRTELCGEAIRLARLTVALLPGRSEAIALLGLMLLQHARRAARFDAQGDLVLLPDQDRGRWQASEIAEGLALAAEALRRPPIGGLALQAAIAAVHASSTHAAATDWPRIVALYDRLRALEPSPVIELNRAVAIAMRDGPAAGLERLDDLAAGPGGATLAAYHLFHASRADLLRRLGRTAEAAAGYRQALDLAGTAAERRFLERRLRDLGAGR